MVNDHSNDTLALEIEYNFPNLKALYEREKLYSSLTNFGKMRVVDPYSFKITLLRLMRREWVLAPNGVCQADLGSFYNPRLVKALSARA